MYKKIINPLIINQKILHILEFIKNYFRKQENSILFLCLLLLAVYFLLTTGRFLDPDEEYFFYATSAVSNGAGLYADLHFYYPPALWLIGAAFFKLLPNLYLAMLATRFFIVMLSLFGFYLIFDIFRKLNLSLFIIPTTIFILFSMQFDLKLMEYRSDHLLALILILQAYLILLLLTKKKPAFFEILLMLILGILSFHINQKAVILEPPLFLTFLFFHFDKVKQFLLKYKTSMIIASLLLAAFIAVSSGYHRFFYQCYIYPQILIRRMKELFPEFSFRNGVNFLTFYVKHDLTFWLLGLISFITFPFYLKKDSSYFLPFILMVSAAFLILNSCFAFFPFLQYQLYLVWAVLFALPFFIKICCEAFPQKKTLIFSIITILALLEFFTFEHFTFPLKPLKIYAQEIERVKEAIGKNGIASLGGATLNIRSDLPFCGQGQHFVADEAYCQSKDLRKILRDKGSKFFFVDQREATKKFLVYEDGLFIRSNYQKCPNLPLMIASKWISAKAGTKKINIDIGGEYRILLFSNGNNPVLLDNALIRSGQILSFDQGEHLLKASAPAAICIEYNSDKIRSESLENLSEVKYSFIPLRQNFSNKFELLGVLRYQRSNRLYFRIFWKALSDINDDLMTFHHFCDINEKYLGGENVDPTDGWYNIKALKKDAEISYEFSSPLNPAYRSMHVGWFFKQDWSKRLEYNKSTFYEMRID